MKFCCLIFFVFYCNLLSAQNYVEGHVTTVDGLAIGNANVTLLLKNDTRISAFAITNSEGFFKIVYHAKDSVLIRVSLVGYKQQAQKISNTLAYLKFILTEQTTELPTVIVKQLPIIQNGDTIDYVVKQFINIQDRVIGDVTAKLPGVEIDETSGQIKFNGKPISHYYIDGLDLLEQKYNIANRNIPADLVDKVQILNNHQDIKLFDSLKISTEPALNIKLKAAAKNKFIGKIKTGLGIVPLLWDNEITGLNFKKTTQLISAYKNNNTGVILSNELLDNISIQKVGEQAEKNTKEEIINKLNVQTPLIAAKRYLYNNTHLIFLNVLQVLSNKNQLKINASFLNDNIVSQNSLQSTYYLPNGEQVNFAEKRNGFINSNKVEGNIIYDVNTKKVYLKNTLKAKLDFTKETSSIINPALVLQTLQNPFYEYSNNFLAHIPVRKKIVSISSKINFNKMPQQLALLPGQFTSIFNQGLAYERLNQQVILKNFNTDNSISFFSKIGKVNQQIKIGTEYIHKNLQSNIDKIYNQTVYKLSEPFNNNLIWNNLRLYAENNTTIGKENAQLEISLPVELNVLNTENKINQFKQQSTNEFFNPNVNFNFDVSNSVNGSLGYFRNNSVGSVTNITTGYILNNYRYLNKNDSLIPLQKLHSINLSFSYKNPLNAVFSNIAISLSQTKKNLIYNQVFDGLFIQSKAIYLDNFQKSIMLNGLTSKYFIDAKINLALNYGYSIFKTDLLQQNKLVKSNSQIISAGFKMSLNMLSFAAIESNTKFEGFRNKIQQPIVQSAYALTNTLQQFLKVYFYISKSSTLYFNNELYKNWDNHTNKGTYFFGDVGYKKKYKKYDLEIEWNNFTNRKSYTTITNSENFKQINSYQIRPTNLVIKCYFNF